MAATDKRARQQELLSDYSVQTLVVVFPECMDSNGYRDFGSHDTKKSMPYAEMFSVVDSRYIVNLVWTLT